MSARKAQAKRRKGSRKRKSGNYENSSCEAPSTNSIPVEYVLAINPGRNLDALRPASPGCESYYVLLLLLSSSIVVKKFLGGSKVARPHLTVRASLRKKRNGSLRVSP